MPSELPAPDWSPASSTPPTPLDFTTLFRENVGYVCRTLRALGVPDASLDDAAQEVFITVHRRLSEFAGRSQLRTWIYSIAYHTALNYRRHARRHPVQTSDEPELPSSAPEPEQTAQATQAADFVLGFVKGLSDEKRDLFVMVLLEGLSIPQASEILGLKLNTAYSRVRLLRAEFRRALATVTQEVGSL